MAWWQVIVGERLDVTGWSNAGALFTVRGCSFEHMLAADRLLPGQKVEEKVSGGWLRCSRITLRRYPSSRAGARAMLVDVGNSHEL